MQFKSCLKMSVRQVNAPTHYWKKIRQYIFLMPVLIYVKNTKSIFKYKGIMILEGETITAELLLTKFAYQQRISFAIWKTTLSREIQARLDCWFFCSSCIHYVDMNHGLCLLFHYLLQGSASLKDCSFVSDGHKKPRVFSK